MTTLNKIVIYSSMVFFFSSVIAMKQGEDLKGSTSSESEKMSPVRQSELKRNSFETIPILSDGDNLSDNELEINVPQSLSRSFFNYPIQITPRKIPQSESMNNIHAIDDFLSKESCSDADSVLTVNSANMRLGYNRSNSSANLKRCYQKGRFRISLGCNKGEKQTSYLQPHSENMDEIANGEKADIGKYASSGNLPPLPKENLGPRPRKRNNKSNRRKDKRNSYSTAQLLDSENAEEHCSVPKPMHRNTKIIISIDGGGVRGIVPLTFLITLQNAIWKEFCMTLPDFVDAFIGVSVGALIATTAVIGKMKYVNDNFYKIDKEIFTRNKWSKYTFGLVGAWYSSKGKEKVIKEILEGTNISEFQTRLLIPFYSNNTNEPVMFDSQNPIVQLFDSLMATSAASTYFEPHKCETINGKTLQGIDPGVNKNSPALLAYEMMREQYPDDYLILASIGTGTNSKVKSFSEYPVFLPAFAWKLPNIVMDSAVHWDEWTIKHIENIDPFLTYKRFQIGLDECITDSVDKEYIDTLRNATLASILSTISPDSKRFSELIDLLSGVIRERGI